MDGGGDPERQQALEQYKNKLLESREWEAKLKALRMDIKGLQGDFETTEDNIKALQSVGQIIGEVLKQLDEERCEGFRSLLWCLLELILHSHRQSFLWSKICRWLPIKSRQSEAEARNPRCA
jgi:ATP-dependent 26S proteasome regulatory subunit